MCVGMVLLLGGMNKGVSLNAVNAQTHGCLLCVVPSCFILFLLLADTIKRNSFKHAKHCQFDLFGTRSRVLTESTLLSGKWGAKTK